MITRVQVKNFRNLADVDVSLGPLTVLVGRNGAGKSTLLDVLRFVRDALKLGLDTAISQRGGIAAIRRWSPPGKSYDIEISISVTTPDIWGDYSFTISSSEWGGYQLKREAIRVQQLPTEEFIIQEIEWKDGIWVKPFHLTAVEGLFNIPIDPQSPVMSTAAFFSRTTFGRLQEVLLQTSFYDLSPKTLRKLQNPANERTLADDGENLATVLQHLGEKQDLLAALERIVEGVSDVRIQEAGGFLITELKHERQEGRAAWFSLAQESDGTLRMLGLLTALYQEAPRTLIALEEPELAIYPGALNVLSDVIKEAATRSQILITTQSPDLISQFSADQLRVVEQVDGAAQIGPVDERQLETLNEQLFTTGDLLRIEGLRLDPPVEDAEVHA